MNTPIERILRRPEVQQMTGLCCSAIYARMEQGTFPKPVKLGPQAVGWKLSDVQAWIATLEQVS
ncbi:MAG: DNA-binding protein [Halioglobus sp.]|mgnify:CR=1 FL=1|nr:DNA-binding protein [Halioglobus sp.]